MIVGSMSSNLCMVPRATQDADFVIESDEAIAQLRQKLAPVFCMDPHTGFETKLMTTKFLFHQPSTAFELEVSLLSEDEHDRERFKRRRPVVLDGLRTFAPTAEDMIIQKIRWSRRQDLSDVISFLQTVCRNTFDWPYLHAWAGRHGLGELLDRLVPEAGEELDPI
jgi:hypothetical protein